ncbi:MAG: GNAT family protein [Gemmatimonadota bacterium]
MDEDRNGPEDSPVGPGDEARYRMLRLVTTSFCREIIDYGVSVRDLLKVSSHVLDFASAQADRPRPRAEGAFGRFSLDDVHPEPLKMGTTMLRPCADEDLALVAGWVGREEIRKSMLVPYPTDEDELRSHFDADERAYFMIVSDDRAAGLIGAEGIDGHSRRLEMRKFIGEPEMRGRGLGTQATFLWLYHVFEVMDFNKVYIHTHSANARNIRVNRSLGFELEGVLAEEHLRGGDYVDIIRMGLLKRTWYELTR